LGTHTEYFTRADRPLKNFDQLITDTLLSEMKKQALTYHPNQDPKEVTKNSDGTLTLRTDSGEFGPFDQIVFATGRVPLLGTASCSSRRFPYMHIVSHAIDLTTFLHFTYDSLLKQTH
jgi:pyruvate/2-oxoglutarate dehydrogenase complex dihydrolipoamide dehydrogenase (E3) component